MTTTNLYFGSPARSFGEAILVCFKKYVTCSGRASRSEYWYFTLFSIILFFAFIVSTANLGIEDFIFKILLLSFYVYLIFLPHLAVTVRRLHDINRSGWWIGGFWIAILFLDILITILDPVNYYSMEKFSSIIPLYLFGYMIYYILMLVLLCQRGDPSQNRFG